MPTRMRQLSGRDEEGLWLDLEAFPGAGRGAEGIQLANDGNNAGYDEEGLWFLAPSSSIEKLPTDPGLLLAGAQGDVRLRHRAYRSDMNGRELEEMVGLITGGSVSLSNYRDHTWELSLPGTLLEVDDPFDLFGTYMKVVSELWDPFTETWLRFPLGVYLLGPPKGEKDREKTTRDLAGRSLEAVLLEDGVHGNGGYFAAAGTGVLAEVRRICVLLGFDPARLDFPPSAQDVPLTTPLVVDAAQDSAGCYYLRICNRLLAAGGFIALYADKEGRLATKKSAARAERPPDVFYGSSVLRERLVVGTIGEDYEDDRFGNRVVVRSSDALDVEPIVVAVENRDPNSPASVQNFKRVKQLEPIVYENLASREAALAIARGRLAVASGLDAKLTMRTVQDPRLDARQTYSLSADDDSGKAAAIGKWFVTGATLPLDEGASVMEHELSRFEDAVGQEVA